MLELIFAVSGVGLILILGEILWRLKITKGEYARKFVHILTAIFAASWALFMDNQTIILVSMIVVAVVIIVNTYNLFPSIHSIKRATYGEIWFPLGIGVSALIFANPYVYALAVLHMGLADGMAAVVGVSMGKRAGRFTIAGNTKSIAGTLTFIVISFSLYLAYWFYYTAVPVFSENPAQAVFISLSSALIVATVELVAPKGSDNVLVPLSAGLLAVLPTLQLII